MAPTAATGSKSPNLDFRKPLVETFAINERANQLLLSHVAIHLVRLMWLSAADKIGKHPPKLDPDKATRTQVQALLKASAESIRGLIVGYLIAHDSHHRGRIAMLARQAGRPIPGQTGFGLWEWGTWWRECGFGK